MGYYHYGCGTRATRNASGPKVQSKRASQSSDCLGLAQVVFLASDPGSHSAKPPEFVVSDLAQIPWEMICLHSASDDIASVFDIVNSYCFLH